MVLTPSPTKSSAKRRIVILGSTGSIGANCLDVISCFEDRLEPVGLSGHRRWRTLFDQALRCRPRFVTLTDHDAIREANTASLEGVCQLLTGDEGIAKMVTGPDVDVVVTAIVGAALIATAHSIDDFIITFLTIGGGNTLPTLVWGTLRTTLDPRVNAIATMLIVTTIASTIVALRLSRYRG